MTAVLRCICCELCQLFNVCAYICFALQVTIRHVPVPVPKGSKLRKLETREYNILFITFHVNQVSIGMYLHSLDLLAVSDEELADRIAHLPYNAPTDSTPNGEIGM